MLDLPKGLTNVVALQCTRPVAGKGASSVTDRTSSVEWYLLQLIGNRYYQLVFVAFSQLILKFNRPILSG